jgi:hypothetical protein
MENAIDVNGLKGVLINQYDGTGDFQQWKEEVILVLLANDMFCFVNGTDPGNKKTADSRKQRAFAIIALNLSRSCRDCLRHLNSHDPKEAWDAVLSRFEQTSAATKMAVLDSLLGLRCGNSVLDCVSKFNEYVNRLTIIEETLGKDLKVAISLTPICHNCRQRGHLRRNCPNGKRGAIDKQTMTATTNYVKQDYTDDGFEGLPQLTL